MATFKAEVYAHHRKQDGTYNIKIRVIHNKKKRYIPTVWFVESRDLTRSLKIKNQRFIDYTDELIRTYRHRCDEVGEALKSMSVDEVVKIITNESPKVFRLDFIEYGYKMAATITAEGRETTAYTYTSALQSFAGYVGGSVDINDITPRMLNDFAAEIAKHKKSSSIYLYFRLLKTIYKRACKEYNDDDMGVLRIHGNPFDKMAEIRKPSPSRDRALSVEQLRAIAALDRCGQVDRRGYPCARDFALDMYMLSFYLVGMNIADIFTCEIYKDGRISYNRQKTKDRRSDGAYISVKVEKEAEEIISRYRDKEGGRVFNLYRRFSSRLVANQVIRLGMEEIGKEVGIEGLTFYSARHTWATLAVNDVGVDKYTVHQALNHVDDATKITDVYIKKSFSNIDIANRRVIDYVFQQ